MIPVVPLLVAGAAAIGGYVTGQRRWKARREALVAALEAAREPVEPRAVRPEDLLGLPGPVRAYLERAIPAGAPMLAGAEIAQEGEFDAAASGRPRWGRFTARQLVVARRAGFLWDARISVGRGLPVQVRDAYVAGEGVLEVALGGALILVHQRDRGELARGELMRFLAEAPWYPTALLASQGVRWVEGGSRSAIASLSDGGIRASLQFRFGADGLPESVYADARGRMAGRAIEHLPWEGRWGRWEERGGYLVPTEAEVAWITSEGRRPYLRAVLAGISLAAG